MESIFNIFGSQEQAIKLQKPLTSGPFSDTGPLKQRAKSDSSNIYTKRVLGDIRNTIQQSTKKSDAKENPPKKEKSPVCDFAFAGCSRSPLLPRSQQNVKTESFGGPRTPLLPKPQQHAKTGSKIKSTVKCQTPIAQFLDLPKTYDKLSGLKLGEKSTLKTKTPSLKCGQICPFGDEFDLGSPEKQGQEVYSEDNYADIWPATECPSLNDYKRIASFEGKKESPASKPSLDDDFGFSLDIDSPNLESDVFIQDSILASNIIETDIPVAELSPEPYDMCEPEIQGIPPLIEDTYEDIWPACEFPTLTDYKNVATFWNCAKPLDEPDHIELVEDTHIFVDASLSPFKVLVDDGEILIPDPTVGMSV